MKNKSLKLYYIDAAKSIGIFMLIAGYQTSGIIQSAIYSFHMPLFVVISGFLFIYNKGNDKSFKEFLFNKINTLLIPYFTFGLFLIAYGIFCNFFGYSCWYFTSYKQIISLTFNQIIGYGIGTLWFLPFLFCIEIIIFLFMKIKRKYIILLLLISIPLACSGFVVVHTLICSSVKVFVALGEVLTVICRIIVGIPFAIFGIIIFYCFTNLNKRMIINCSIISFLVWFISTIILKSPMVDLYSLNIQNVFRYYLNSITGSFCVIVLCKELFDKKTYFVELFGGSLLYMVFNNLPTNFVIYDCVTMLIGKQVPFLDIISIIISETILVLVFKNSKYLKRLFFRGIK